MTHICVRNLSIIGSDNGLSPGRHQDIIWTNAGILFIGPLGTNFNEILIEIHTVSFKKMHLKMSSGKRRPFCLFTLVVVNSFRRTNQAKLEQLERLRSEDTPAASWLPMPLSHIGSKVKGRQSQSYKFKKIAKISNFWILKRALHATHLLKLLDKMCEYEMDPMSILEDTEWTRFCPQTDRRTRWYQYTPFQLRWSGGIMTKSNLDFQVKFDLKSHGESTPPPPPPHTHTHTHTHTQKKKQKKNHPKNNRDLNQGVCTSSPNLVIS